MVERLFQDLGFHRFLAEKALQLADLIRQRLVRSCWHNRLFGCRRRQRALVRKAAPGKQLVRRNAMSTRNQAHRHAGLHRLGNQRKLFRRCPATATLRSSEDLTLRIVTSHNDDITPTS